MPDSMQERGSRLGSDIGASADQAASAASQMSDRAREVMSDTSAQAKEYFRKGYRLAADKATALKRNSETYITGHPWYAVGIALGVGVLLGLVLRRGRSSD